MSKAIYIKSTLEDILEEMTREDILTLVSKAYLEENELDADLFTPDFIRPNESLWLAISNTLAEIDRAFFDDEEDWGYDEDDHECDDCNGQEHRCYLCADEVNEDIKTNKEKNLDYLRSLGFDVSGLE